MPAVPLDQEDAGSLSNAIGSGTTLPLPIGLSMLPLRLITTGLLLLPLTIPAAQAAPKSSNLLKPDAGQTMSSLADREKSLQSIFSDYWQAYLKHNPELATSIGDQRYNDQWSDYSVQAYNDWLEQGRNFLMQLGGVDTSGMPDQERLSKELLVRQLVENQEEAQFKPWEMPVNQFLGPDIGIPQFISELTFSSVKNYDDYISRLNKIPKVFRQITDDMELGMEDKREPPRYLLEKVLNQVNAIAAQKPEASPFAEPLKKFPSSISAAEQKRIRTEAVKAITLQVMPAYRRFAKFLQYEYVPGGRTEPGLWSLPDGKAYYAFLVKQSTTMDLTPAEVHQIGLEQVKKDEQQLESLAHQLGFSSVTALNAAVKSNPKLHPSSPEQLLNAYRGYIDRMRPKLPELFTRLPKARLEVKAVPAYMAKEQAAAYYDPGSPDGSRPGIVYVNTYDYQSRSLTTVEATAYHEGLPGHHLQISIAQELTGLPEFRRYLYYNAYTEGWGLYAEQLGKDVGFYQDPYSNYGRLQMDMFRSIRLVVDTGVHYDHWSRQQMVDYFHAHSSLDDADVQAEVDRYIAWPAQALGYKIGELQILALRSYAKKMLGPRFDIRTFDDQIVDSGALPLDILRERVGAWVDKTAKQQDQAPESAAR